MIPRADLVQLVRAVIKQVDDTYKGISTPYDNVIDITYYKSKKEAVKGKYNFTTGVIEYDGVSKVWDKHKVKGVAH